MAVDLLAEAKRCYQCKNPQCQKGCPISTPIPEVIKTLLDGDLDKAGQILFDNNPLSVLCSMVCHHEKQCYGHCIQNKKGTPIRFYDIENYISDAYFERMKLELAPPNGMKVAIVGAGPAGLTIAFILVRKGYDVTIFESKEHIGGVLTYGIPEFRLPKTFLVRYRDKLLSLGVKIRPNVTIGTSLSIDDLFRDGYKSVFIGIGVWRPKKLGVKGETLGNVHFALDYLNRPQVFDLGESVAIIGAGNSAMDVARTVLRRGSRKATLYARRNEITGSQTELEYAMLEGANIEFGHEIIEINEKGPVFRVRKFDEEGKHIGYEEGLKQAYADSTIISVSQRALNTLFVNTEGLESTQDGRLVADENGRTTREGVFASGDVVVGSKTVVDAVAFSKQVADSMDQYMQSLPKED